MRVLRGIVKAVCGGVFASRKRNGASRAEAAGWTSAKKPNALPASTSGTHAALEALKKSLLHQAFSAELESFDLTMYVFAA